MLMDKLASSLERNPRQTWKNHMESIRFWPFTPIYIYVFMSFTSLVLSIFEKPWALGFPFRQPQQWLSVDVFGRWVALAS